ncbi:thioredoxin reductase [Microbacteriaceae bacterium SG_E_30_P1]|uniref:Thioredoxin reductase n=1 Tax=Antiquaquibacter oligotrophicus TaxID=2880260 RepID=A0ABT6KMU8_9MICO|nr:NAD(P)/FAD-dependent oxidoreductase [Antiquaquibacter oligotrophicus]MDH6181333.1 thioredoxin reductase [Antiquaquibacter oligotrophicus]UDF12974.1 NAD(P)/FAD-dependent oxidoreductase [Antiquaquibacter oligotrophicus]
MTDKWDAIIIGGGAAGLSAALMLSRARRSVLVIDAGKPRNGVAPHMHGVLGHDGTSAVDLLARGRRDIEGYGGVVLSGDVTDLSPESSGGFRVTSTAGIHRAPHVMVATGLADELPAISGLAELWGTGVVVCPYCDGWEKRDQRIGVIATTPAQHQVQLLRQWSSDVTYFSRGIPLDDVALRALDARGITRVDADIERVHSQDSGAITIDLVDGGSVEVDIVFTAPAGAPRDGFLRALGAAVSAQAPFGGAEFVAVDDMGRTSVPGLWAAGNSVNPAANVPLSMGTGSKVGAAINAELVERDVAAALASAEGVPDLPQ